MEQRWVQSAEGGPFTPSKMHQQHKWWIPGLQDSSKGKLKVSISHSSEVHYLCVWKSFYLTPTHLQNRPLPSYAAGLKAVLLYPKEHHSHLYITISIFFVLGIWIPSYTQHFPFRHKIERGNKTKSDLADFSFCCFKYKAFRACYIHSLL